MINNELRRVLPEPRCSARAARLAKKGVTTVRSRCAAEIAEGSSSVSILRRQARRPRRRHQERAKEAKEHLVGARPAGILLDRICRGSILDKEFNREIKRSRPSSRRPHRRLPDLRRDRPPRRGQSSTAGTTPPPSWPRSRRRSAPSPSEPVAAAEISRRRARPHRRRVRVRSRCSHRRPVLACAPASALRTAGRRRPAATRHRRRGPPTGTIARSTASIRPGAILRSNRKRQAWSRTAFTSGRKTAVPCRRRCRRRAR